MEVIFVYNAKSDPLSTLFGFAHKIVSPSTYTCDLCKLTHSTTGERKAWKAFTEACEIPFTFYHTDEFEKLYTKVFTYPIILKIEGDKLTTLLNAEAISRFRKTEELIRAIKDQL